MPKDRIRAPEKERAAEDYYRLHTAAIDDLVHADESNSPEVSPEELARYTSRRISLAEWVKILLIKFWFNASVCFFFFWGLTAYLRDLPDQMFVLGVAMGIVTDLLVNNILRFYAETEGGNDRWIMFPKKRFASFPLNILYAFVVLFFVYTLYQVINIVIIRFTGASDSVPLGVEPILFGLFYLGIDLLFLTMKQLFLRILRDARRGSH